MNRFRLPLAQEQGETSPQSTAHPLGVQCLQVNCTNTPQLAHHAANAHRLGAGLRTQLLPGGRKYNTTRHAPICNSAGTCRRGWNTNRSLPGHASPTSKHFENCLPQLATAGPPRPCLLAAPTTTLNATAGDRPPAALSLSHTQPAHTHTPPHLQRNARLDRKHPWCNARHPRPTAQHTPPPHNCTHTAAGEAARRCAAGGGCVAAIGRASTCCNCGRVDLAHRGTQQFHTHATHHTPPQPGMARQHARTYLGLSRHRRLCALTHALETGN